MLRYSLAINKVANIHETQTQYPYILVPLLYKWIIKYNKLEINVIAHKTQTFGAIDPYYFSY